MTEAEEEASRGDDSGCDPDPAVIADTADDDEEPGCCKC